MPNGGASSGIHMSNISAGTSAAHQYSAHHQSSKAPSNVSSIYQPNNAQNNGLN
jgi:hypothetical protein